MKNHNAITPPPLWILLLTISFPSVAAVLVAPALPAISDHFNISDALAQYVMISFLIGYAFGQLLYSPLANRFGRKPAFYIGLGIYLLGTSLALIDIWLNSYYLLLVSRVFMALGSGCGLVLTHTIINDVYPPS